MKDAQKPDHISLTTLVSRLKEGRFVIPDFQREFEWKPWDIRDLLRSIFLDYYIGSLLLWKGKSENFDALACEPVYGRSDEGSPEHIVLDGQQRLTAIYYTFVAPDVPLPERANRYLYFIHVDRFMEEAYDEAFDYQWTASAERLLDDRSAQFEKHVFPISVIGKGGFELANWVQGYEAYWQDRAVELGGSGDKEAAEQARRHATNGNGFGGHLLGVTQEYQIAYIELDSDLAIDKVCDIFTQVNSKGIRLDVFDLMNAMLKPKGLQLKKIWRKAAPELEFVETPRMNVYILQVMSILRQAYCSPKYLYYLLPGQEKVVRKLDGSLNKEVLVADKDEFRSRWDQAVDAVAKAIEMLRHPQEFGVVSSQYLPYVSILPVFSALQSRIKDLPPNDKLDAQRKVRHWYWASVFTYRYSGSVESTAARDYLDVNTWFSDDMAAPPLIAEFKDRFRSLELHKEVRRGTSVYNGIFNLFVIREARDWMTGNVPQHGELDDHHIVPKAWAKGKDGVGRQIDSILNRTPLTADTNRHVISDKLPNAYLPELMTRNGEDTVRETLASHLISPAAFNILLRDPFTPEDFDEFLQERKRTIQDGIEDLLVKERLDLPPRLRDLDSQIETVELGFRSVIVKELDGDASQLPSHVVQKVKERVDVASRRNPALDVEQLKNLQGMIEYFDLREIQDVFTNKNLWPLFSDRFGSKEALANRFTQLADLRNGIRHSRSVDQVTSKDGEAALLWFGNALTNSA